jgi:hypothetical protein
MKTHFAFLALLLTLTGHALAQAPGNANTHQAPAIDPLHGACNSAWLEVADAIFTGKKLHGLEARTVQQKVGCLLNAISTATFDARGDQRWNDFLAGESIVLLVGAYGPAGYDYFASQIPLQPARVRNALIGTLFKRGQPEAVEAYFTQRRQQFAAADTTFADAAPARFEALLVKGECAEPPCSTRMAETLRIVAQNLDSVERDLRTAADTAPRAQATAEELRTINQRRKVASDLLEVVGRIRRGEAVVGKAW